MVDKKLKRGVDNVVLTGNNLLVECVKVFSELELNTDPDKIVVFNSNIVNSSFASFKVVKTGKEVKEIKEGQYIQINEIYRAHWVNIPDNEYSVNVICKKLRENSNKDSIVVTIPNKIVGSDGKTLTKIPTYNVIEYLIIPESTVLIAWDN